MLTTTEALDSVACIYVPWYKWPYQGRFTHSMLRPCSSPEMPCRFGFKMCLSPLIYTLQPCLINTCHALPMPCSDHAVFLKATARHGSIQTAVLCCGLEKDSMVGAWHGHGMACVNQTRPPCVNQIGKTNSDPLEALQGNLTLCVNRPYHFAICT